MPPFPNKMCLDCHEAKPFEEFYAASGRRDGRMSYCKPCHRARMKKWSAANVEKRRRYAEKHHERMRRESPEYRRAAARRHLCKQYGLTVEAYNALLESQGGGCALCGRQDGDGKALAIDHCHESGRVRGLLCTGCNTSLGRLGDTVEGLRRALAYLERGA